MVNVRRGVKGVVAWGQHMSQEGDSTAVVGVVGWGEDDGRGSNGRNLFLQNRFEVFFKMLWMCSIVVLRFYLF